VHFLLPADVHGELLRLAYDRGQTVSDYCRDVLVEHLRSRQPGQPEPGKCSPEKA
jgi:hypothetical protein